MLTSYWKQKMLKSSLIKVQHSELETTFSLRMEQDKYLLTFSALMFAYLRRRARLHMQYKVHIEYLYHNTL
jgi:hypothetical protein